MDNKNTRDASGRWLPGFVQNPGGRTALGKEFKELLRDKCYDRAVQVLSECLQSDDERMRFAAAREVFDRLIGKPAQIVGSEVTESLAYRLVILPPEGSDKS